MKKGYIVCWQLNGDKGSVTTSDFFFHGVMYPADELFSPVVYWRIKSIKTKQQ